MMIIAKNRQQAWSRCGVRAQHENCMPYVMATFMHPSQHECAITRQHSRQVQMDSNCFGEIPVLKKIRMVATEIKIAKNGNRSIGFAAACAEVRQLFNRMAACRGTSVFHLTIGALHDRHSPSHPARCLLVQCSLACPWILCCSRRYWPASRCSIAIRCLLPSPGSSSSSI